MKTFSKIFVSLFVSTLMSINVFGASDDLNSVSNIKLNNKLEKVQVWESYYLLGIEVWKHCYVTETSDDRVIGGTMVIEKSSALQNFIKEQRRKFGHMVKDDPGNHGKNGERERLIIGQQIVIPPTGENDRFETIIIPPGVYHSKGHFYEVPIIVI